MSRSCTQIICCYTKKSLSFLPTNHSRKQSRFSSAGRVDSLKNRNAIFSCLATSAAIVEASLEIGDNVEKLEQN